MVRGRGRILSSKTYRSQRPHKQPQAAGASEGLILRPPWASPRRRRHRTTRRPGSRRSQILPQSRAAYGSGTVHGSINESVTFFANENIPIPCGLGLGGTRRRHPICQRVLLRGRSWNCSSCSITHRGRWPLRTIDTPCPRWQWARLHFEESPHWWPWLMPQTGQLSFEELKRVCQNFWSRSDFNEPLDFQLVMGFRGKRKLENLGDHHMFEDWT